MNCRFSAGAKCGCNGNYRVHITLDDFCVLVVSLERSNAEKAVALLWFHDRRTPDIAITSGRLTKLMIDHHVGTPNPSQLATRIRETRLVNEAKGGFILKPGSRRIIREWFPAQLDGSQPTIDHSTGYLSEAIWREANHYVVGVCRQLNGCFAANFHDAAAVMLRRLIETLIIDAYEAVGRRADIVDGGDNPFMLNALADRAIAPAHPASTGLGLGREAKAALKAIKAVGDRSAHNRRVLANRADLDTVRTGARTAVEELLVVVRTA